MLGDRDLGPVHDVVVDLGRDDVQAFLDRVEAERVHDLVAGAAQVGLGEADEVDRGDERLRLDRQQPGGTVERVRVRLRVDVDLARSASPRRRSRTRPPPKLTTLSTAMSSRSSVGESWSCSQTSAHEQRLADFAGGDQHGRERDEPREALRADAGVPAAAAAVRLDGRDGDRRAATARSASARRDGPRSACPRGSGRRRPAPAGPTIRSPNSSAHEISRRAIEYSVRNTPPDRVP